MSAEVLTLREFTYSVPLIRKPLFIHVLEEKLSFPKIQISKKTLQSLVGGLALLSGTLSPMAAPIFAESAPTVGQGFTDCYNTLDYYKYPHGYLIISEVAISGQAAVIDSEDIGFWEADPRSPRGEFCEFSNGEKTEIVIPGSPDPVLILPGQGPDITDKAIPLLKSAGAVNPDHPGR